ncbi:MAG TPA: DUF2905 domain-containing protein [Candidatus Limnocylindrales bacterium]|nr:DUF2905 domain-containing protein [Candidatus Limnocylindrales bacterium]
MSNDLEKNLILIGLIVVGIGLFMTFFQKGGSILKLPGDITIKKENFAFYFL